MQLIYDWKILYNNIFKKSIGFYFFLTEIVHIFVNPKNRKQILLFLSNRTFNKLLILTDLWVKLRNQYGRIVFHS